MAFTIITDVSTYLGTFIWRKLAEFITLKLCMKIKRKIKEKIAELILKQHKKMSERRQKRKNLCKEFNIDIADCTDKNVELAQIHAASKLLSEKFSVIENQQKEKNFFKSLFTITKEDLWIILVLCLISPFEIINKLFNIK
jgi:hypothetical protein